MNRETTRCNNCSLNQFVTKSGDCRKCGWPLFPVEEPVPVEKPSVVVEKRTLRVDEDEDAEMAKAISVTIRSLRGNEDQRSFAKRMGVPRTYISKMENTHCTPNIRQIFRLAVTCRVTPAEFVSRVELAYRGMIGE